MPVYKASAPSARLGYVPAGDYTVEVLEAEESVSKNGNDMIELKLRVQPEGPFLFDALVFTPKAFWKVDAFRAATGETVVPEEDVVITPGRLVGRTGRARLGVEEYDQRKRNTVVAWLPPQPDRKEDGAKAGTCSAPGEISGVGHGMKLNS